MPFAVETPVKYVKTQGSGEDMLGGIHPSIERLQFAPVQSVAAIGNVAKLSASVPLVVDEGEKWLESLTKSGGKRLGEIITQVIDCSSFKDALQQLDHSHQKTFHAKTFRGKYRLRESELLIGSE